MAWTTFTTGSATVNHGLLWYSWKQILVTAGWTVVSSGDGSAAYSSTGDILTSRTFGIANGVNNGAWFRAQNPDGVEICSQFIAGAVASSATAFTCRDKYSASAGFTGGSPDPNTVPSATDEGVFRGGGSDAVPAGTNFGSSLANNNGNRHFAFGIFEDVSPYRFIFVISQDFTGTRAVGGWMHDMVTVPSTITIPHPMVIYAAGKGTSQLEAFGEELFNATYGGAAGADGGAFCYQGAATTANFVEVRGQGPDDVGDTNVSLFPAGAVNTFDLVPLFWCREDGQAAPAGAFGNSTLLRYVMQLLSSPNNRNFKVVNSSTPAQFDFIRANNIAFEWFEAADPFTDTASADREAIMWPDPLQRTPDDCEPCEECEECPPVATDDEARPTRKPYSWKDRILRTLRRLFVKEPKMDNILRNVYDFADEVSQIDILNGRFVDVRFTLAELTQTVIHKLDREYKGYFPVRSTTHANFKLANASSTNPKFEFQLTADQACDVTFWVF